MADTKDTTVIRIAPFSVENTSDDAVIQDWRMHAEQIRHASGFVKSILYRSVLDNSSFRFVDMSMWASDDAFNAVIVPANEESTSQSVPPLYHVTVRLGQPPQALEVSEHFILINPVQLPVAMADQFLNTWTPQAQFASQQPGFLGGAMHHALSEETPFQFVISAWWKSVEEWTKTNERLQTRYPASINKALPRLFQACITWLKLLYQMLRTNIICSYRC